MVAGNSGGAPETVLDSQTGYVVDGRKGDQIVETISGLLAHPDRAATMGRRGRDWVMQDWQWDTIAARAAVLLHG